MTTLLVTGGVVIAGCHHAPIGQIGFLTPGSEPVGTKLLRPGVVSRSCQAFVLGVPIGASLSVDDAVARLLALDAEGNALTNTRVTWHRLWMGVYDRDCLEVRGDLVRTISTITVPHVGHEH